MLLVQRLSDGMTLLLVISCNPSGVGMEGSSVRAKRFSIHHKKHVLAASMTRIAVQDCKHSGIQAGVVWSHSGRRFLEIGPSHP